MGNEFREDELAIISTDKSEIFFENNNKSYKLIFWNTTGGERFRAMSFKMVKAVNIVIYLFDLNGDKGVDPNFIEEIKENKDKTIINSSRIVLFSHGDIPGKNMCYCSFIRS